MASSESPDADNAETSGRQSAATSLLPIFAVALVTAALVWLSSRDPDARGDDGREDGGAGVVELERTVERLTARVAELEAQQRTVSSLLLMRDGRSVSASSLARGTPSSTARETRGTGDLAAKPVEETQDAAERARRIGDDAIARALEHVTALPSEDAVILPNDAPVDPAAATPVAEGAGVDGAPEAGEVDEASAREAATKAILIAFNQLLADAGLRGWKLLAATPFPEERALKDVVLSHHSEQGTAIGSLSASRLTLDRDPITGVAGLSFTGARGLEGGIEIAYQDSVTRVEIPGILPLDLLAPCLREVFAVGTPEEAAEMVETGDQVARTINRVLALEKTVALRIRTVDRLEDRTLKKVVIDLSFDEHGDAWQSVIAEEAWFEIDPAASYGELCCEQGEMIEKGLRRPLFRGKLRLPLREITAERWRGVPSVRLTAGS